MSECIKQHLATVPGVIVALFFLTSIGCGSNSNVSKNSQLQNNSNSNQPSENEIWSKFEMGFHFYESGHPEEAINYFSEAIELDDRRKNDSYSYRGLAFLEMNKLDQALDDCTKAIELQGETDIDSAILYMYRSHVWRKLNDYQKSHEDIGKAFNLYEKEISGQSYKGISGTEWLRSDFFILEKTRQIESNPNDADAFYRRGILFAQTLAFERAISDYGKSIELDPSNPEVYVNRGTAFAKLGESKQALANYGKALEISPEDSSVFYNRGITHYALKENQAAISDYNQAIKLGFDVARVYYNRGLVYQEMGNTSQAIADYSRAIELDHNYHDSYYNRGLMYLELQEYQDAIDDFEKIYFRLPKEMRPKVWLSQGVAHTKLGEYEKAIVNFSDTIKADSFNSDAYFNRGRAWEELGEIEKAKADFETASIIEDKFK